MSDMLQRLLEYAYHHDDEFVRYVTKVLGMSHKIHIPKVYLVYILSM